MREQKTRVSGGWGGGTYIRRGDWLWSHQAMSSADHSPERQRIFCANRMFDDDHNAAACMQREKVENYASSL